MRIRKMCAENFYPGNIQAQIENFTQDFDISLDIDEVVAGVVPHAGWMFSGRVAAHIFAALRKYSDPESIILFGTVHNQHFVKRSSVFSEGAWQTPRGDVAVDDKLAADILGAAGDLLVDDCGAHEGEHSIEVQIPFVQYFFPESKIVPIAVIPNENAVPIGGVIADIVRKLSVNAVTVGTTDLTHYGYTYGFMPAGHGREALRWMNANDQSIINRALDLDAGSIVREAQEKRNACGPGALAATVAFAKKCGASTGTLVEYTTSYDVMPDNEFAMGVGYAGLLF